MWEFSGNRKKGRPRDGASDSPGKNLTQPNVGFQAEDKVPMEWRLGTAYQSKQMPWLVPALDLSRRDGVTGVYGGLESWLFHDALGVRAGGNRDEASAGELLSIVIEKVRIPDRLRVYHPVLRSGHVGQSSVSDDGLFLDLRRSTRVLLS